MKVTPIITEKTMGQAKNGIYTFLAPFGLGKKEIRELINKIYAVNVTKIATINYKAGVKTNFRGKKVSFSARKKAMVTLTKDEKIDAFEKKGGKNK